MNFENILWIYRISPLNFNDIKSQGKISFEAHLTTHQLCGLGKVIGIRVAILILLPETVLVYSC